MNLLKYHPQRFIGCWYFMGKSELRVYDILTGSDEIFTPDTFSKRYDICFTHGFIW